MILALAIVLGLVVAAHAALSLRAFDQFQVVIQEFHAALADERNRSRELLTILQAQAAPAEHAAYIAPLPPAPERTYLTSPDGLISLELDDG